MSLQAIILCGGKSTRTYPLTITKPKPLLKVANKPMLGHLLDKIKDYFDEIILVLNYHADQIKNFIDANYPNYNIKFVEQDEPRGTGDAIFRCKDLIRDKFIVINGDDFYGPDLTNNLDKYRYSILVHEVENISQYGKIIHDDNGKIVRIHEKPPEYGPGLANTGVYVLDRKIFEFDPELSERGEYEIISLINKLIEHEEVYYQKIATWLPVTYPWNLLDINEFLLSNIESDIQGQVEAGAIIKGKIILGQNSIIKSGAYIEGNVIIGENCIIGPNCYIRGYTSIGNNCKIGNAVEIKNSIIGDNTNVAHLSYIGDSILGDFVNLGAGTITANLRHDESYILSEIKDQLINTNRKKLGAIIADRVHTGINTSIYPGRKMWPDTTTRPGEVVTKDIK
ncbi:MAG: sugar phosphate nucleotidyltransferase [Candidatus Dojkabacteria bacterium]|nr:sugar phosphate nucleotidyltransferase [Candidatus Dojkabacteria bacterium]